jgi:hypothetical protein
MYLYAATTYGHKTEALPFASTIEWERREYG